MNNIQFARDDNYVTVEGEKTAEVLRHHQQRLQVSLNALHHDETLFTDEK